METRSHNKIAVLSAALMASITLLPAQSNVLHGYLEHTAEQTAPAATPNQSSSPAPNSAPSTDSVSGAVEALIPESYPPGYQGSWHCVTTVVDSGVPAIPAGQIMLSDVTFARQPDGRITAAWTQPGWTESTSSVTAFSSTEARVDRTNYFVSKDLDQSWAARSRDQFTQNSRQSITAKSYVDQYIDGQFVGRYRTTSLLQKSPGSDIAFAQ
ncbi:MAG: hypothetical protein U0103_20555 [Candidatus Obscuribacterales bacterium]